MAVVRDRVLVHEERLRSAQEQRDAVQGQLAAADTTAGPSGSLDALRAQLARVNAEIDQCHAAIALEMDRRERENTENIRRRHNYIPFIMKALQLLAEKGELDGLVKRAKQPRSQS